MPLQPYIISEIERLRQERHIPSQPAIPLGPWPPSPVPIEHPGWDDGDETTQSSRIVEIDL